MSLRQDRQSTGMQAAEWMDHVICLYQKICMHKAWTSSVLIQKYLNEEKRATDLNRLYKGRAATNTQKEVTGACIHLGNTNFRTMR